MKKILLSEAKAALLDMMKTSGEISVVDAVEELDLAKTTIRQHLQLLEQYGLVKRRQKREGRGRPRIMYSLTPKADEFYPSHEETLLEEFIDYLIDQEQGETVRHFFDRHWEHLEKRAQERLRVADDSLVGRVKALEGFLHEHGFVPQVRVDEDEASIRVCNCPYKGVVDATRVPCQRELELLETTTDTRARRTSYILDGEPCCVYHLEPVEAAGKVDKEPASTRA
ncbi:MAG: helix-turn-helix transcriptional regulator [Persicimonas sp.]